MKRIFKKFLISICMILVLSNFIMGIPGIPFNKAYAVDWGDILGGIVGILMYPLKLPIIAASMGINTIVSTLYKLGLGPTAASPGSSFFVTPYEIIFNKMELVNINFFNLNSGHSTADAFRAAVASWYYTMRIIASMILLVILVYVGIRMALSTIADEKAKYKKMLVDWTTSIALLFLLHYIIQFVFACNEALVNAMDSLAKATSMDAFADKLIGLAFAIDLIKSVTGIAVYSMLIFLTLSFLITYMKRMITVGFLIIIAPLITITYSIDKMGDGKSQALNNWLKEFIYNVLIQPFHCILYLSFGKIALDLLGTKSGDEQIAVAILAILCMQFIKDGEKIVKKIFGFDAASSMGALSEGAKMAGAAMGVGTKVGMAAGKVAGKGVDKLANTKAGKALSNATKQATGRVGQAATQLGKKMSAANKKRQENKKKELDDLKKKEAERKPLTMKEHQQLNKMKAKEAKKEQKAAEKQAKETAKLEKQMKKLAGGEAEYQKIKDKGENSEDYKKLKMDATNALKEKRQKISGYAGKAGKGALRLATAPTRALTSKQTVATLTGIATGMIGLGDSMTTAMNTYQLGSGFAKGFFGASTRSARNELENQVNLQNNLGVEIDEKHLALVKTRGDGNAYDNKVIENKLQQLLDKLNELGVKNAQGAVADLNYDLSFNSQSINQTSIEEMLNKAGISDENKDAAMSAMMGFAQFRADAGLYQAMEGGNAVGMSMGDILGTATGANKTEKRETSSNKEHRETTTYEVHHEEENVDMEEVKKTAAEAGRQAGEEAAKGASSVTE